MKIFGINLTTTDIWLLGIVGSISLILVRYWLNLSKDKIKRNREISDRFARLIADEISVLKNGERIGSDRFENIFRKQNIAAIEFSKTLGFFKLRKFNYLWDQYCNATNEKEFIQPVGAIGYINHRKSLEILEKIIRLT